VARLGNGGVVPKGLCEGGQVSGRACEDGRPGHEVSAQDWR